MCKFSTGQKLVGTYYDWNKIHPKEQYYVNSAGQKSGSYKLYNENGVVIKEYNYLNGVENGLCIDYEATQNNQRVVAAKGTFKNGDPDGYYVQYCREDGYKAKVQEGQYKIGKKTGLWKEWWCDDDTKGVLKTVGIYKDGIQDGEWTSYSRKATIDSKGNYLAGAKNGSWRYYFANGSLWEKGSYNNDKPNGTWYFYGPNDSTKSINTGEFVDGNKTGPWKIFIDGYGKEVLDQSSAATYRLITFDKNGSVSTDKVQDFYITGEKIWEGYLSGINPPVILTKGVTTYYYKSGTVSEQFDFDKLKYKAFYENGKLKQEAGLSGTDLSGNGKEYFENGNPKSEGSYIADKADGSWKYFYENGKLKYDVTYEKGVKKLSYKYDESGQLDSLYRDGYQPMGKTEILERQICQMLIFIVDDKVGKSKFAFDILKSPTTLSQAFMNTESGYRNVAGKLDNPVLARYDEALQPARELYIKSEEYGVKADEKKEYYQKIIFILKKIIG